MGRRFGDQVRRVRGARGMTQEQLSQALEAVGRPIPVASVGRLESGDRRVDVDDPAAIAYVLNVSPLALLMPFTDAPSTEVDLIGTSRRVPAFDAWLWALGVEPHHVNSASADGALSELYQFRAISHPWWIGVYASQNHDAMTIRRRWPSPPTDRPDPMYDSSGEAP